jgi:hypothetical protein
MNAVKTLFAGALGLAVAGFVGFQRANEIPPAPGCAGGRCVMPIEEARTMTTQSVSAPRGREMVAALELAAKKATAKATFGLG